MLDHGGNLQTAAKQYGIAVDNWIDLSTGINPNHYPIPDIPVECFSRLPENNDGLLEAAQQYYQADNLLPIAGSQAAIQLLPALRKRSKVAVPDIGYAEHAYRWHKEGHEVVFYKTGDIETIINSIDVLVLINPNNPTGECYTRNQILNWHKVLKSNGGWLIVDEAFIDCENIRSSIDLCNREGLIVLRSVGKYFGLAGLRGGFVFSEKNLLMKLQEKLGPWAISGVSRYIIKHALLDTTWQTDNKAKIEKISSQMNSILYNVTGIQPVGTHLYKTILHPDAENIHRLFAEQGLLVRLLDNKKGLRFGLPAVDQISNVNKIIDNVFSNHACFDLTNKVMSA